MRKMRRSASVFHSISHLSHYLYASVLKRLSLKLGQFAILLQAHEVCVDAASAQELVVCAAIGDCAILEHHDEIAAANCAEPVGDGDARAALA